MTAASFRNPYVFVVGCPRSGTTLLQRVLDSHPDLAVINEVRFVPRVLADHGLDTDAPLTPAMVAEARSYHRFRQLGLADDEVEHAASVSSTYAEFVTALFDGVAAARGKRLAGEKTPDYARHLPLLGRLFPSTRIVHIIRDGRDVALSLLTWAAAGKGPGRHRLWQENPVATSALWWSELVTQARRNGEALAPARYREVRYEDLVSDSERVARELAGFLELPYAPEMVRFHAGRRRHDPRLSAKSAWLPPTKGLRDWRRDMDPRDVELFEALAGDVLSSLGYERAFPEVSAAAAGAVEFADAWTIERAPRSSAPSRRPPMDASDALRALRDRGYAPMGEAFAVGRPGHTTVTLTSPAGDACVAKLYAAEGGAEALTAMRAVWVSSFGSGRTRPGLPKPLEYVDAARALVMQRVEGRPMVELDGPRYDLVDGAIGLLAELHASDARSLHWRDARGVVRAARRKLREVAAADEELGDRFASVVAALEARRPDAVPLVPSHGDFSARNVLAGDGGLVLIDWDRFRLADPARDLTYFGLWDWAAQVQRGEEPSWATLDRALDRYDALRAEARVRERAEFYVAAGLARVAHAMVMMWRRDTEMVVAVLDEARRHLT